MWQRKIRFFSFVFAFLFLFASAQSFGDAYLITDSEITQILDECEALRIELSILKSNSLADKASLKRLNENLTELESRLQKANENLTNTRNELISALEQLREAKAQLKELEASLKKSKLAALWQTISIGGICLAVGGAVGFVSGVIVGGR